MNSYTLSGDTARRLMKALAWYERQPQGGPEGLIELPGARNKQIILVTGENTDDTVNFWYYGGRVVHWSAATDEWIPADDCYLVCDVDTPLQVGTYHIASQTGNHSDGTPTFVTTLSCCTGSTTGTCEVGTDLCICVKNVRFYYKQSSGGVPPPDLFDAANIFYTYTGPECHTLVLAGSPPGGAIDFDDYATTYPATFGPFATVVSGTLTLTCALGDPGGEVTLVFTYGIGSSLGYLTQISGTFPNMGSILGTFTLQNTQVSGSLDWYGHRLELTIADGAC
jgi:hypothetical protein